jgi:hypothetical protein
MRTGRVLAWMLVTLCLAATPSLVFGDRAETLAKKASVVQREVCDTDANTMQSCHENFSSGCGRPKQPNPQYQPRYDAYLNFLKNQTPQRTLQPIENLAQEKFARLDEDIPDGVRKGNNAEYAEELAQLGQGNIYSVVGFLYLADPTGAESTNCGLGRRGNDVTNVDFHLHVGWDESLAQRLRGGERPTTKNQRLEFQKVSVVVEMTPHYRAKFQPRWTIDRVRAEVGQQVKVVGQLLLDNEHVNPNDNCADPGARDSCWRKSAWELHPAIEFYVCISAPCDVESPNWVKLADRP